MVLSDTKGNSMDNMEMIVNTVNVKLYKKDDDYILELWSSSTKHPDYVKTLSSYEKISKPLLKDYLSIEERLFYLLTYVASEMMWISTSKKLIEIALQLINK